MDSKYKIGTIGLGHWVKRLYQALNNGNRMTLFKAVARKPYGDRKEELELYGIPKDRYFTVDQDGNVPEEFFEGLDVVQIASPNKFHSSQLLQCLEKNKLAVVEKTFAVSKSEFDKMLHYIKSNNHDNHVFLHLHYLIKALTVEMKRVLPKMIEEHGKITKFDAAFFEKVSEEGAKRVWLLATENGGIFMDWVHPLTILVHALGTESTKLVDAKTYIVRPEYDNINPTAVEVKYEVTGPNFADNAVAEIRIGEGFQIDAYQKRIRLYFEDGSFADFKYLDTPEEFETGKRGSWELYVIEDGKPKLVESKDAVGKLSYEALIDEVIQVLEGDTVPITLEDLAKIYEPEWQFQEIVKGLKPITDQTEIQKLLTYV